MGMERPQERIYRGFEFEEACLGHKIDWDSVLHQNKISPEKLNLREWTEIIKKLYPEDPIMPKQKWGRDLYDFVADKLELDIENPEGLMFFNSLGTPLDRKRDTDCFFVFKNPKTKKEALFTIDLTSDPRELTPGVTHQDSLNQADLVIGEMPDYHKYPEAYILEMEKIADKISEKLKDKTETVH